MSKVKTMSAEEVNQVMGGEIVQKPACSTALATTRQGFEDIQPGDISIPRLKLLQAMSPEITDGMEGVKVGDILITTTKQKIGGNGSKLRIVPIMSWKEWIRWEGVGANATILWRSRDPMDERVVTEGKWHGDEAPLAQETRHFLVMVPHFDLPAVISFSKTKFPVGRQLYTAAYASGGAMFDFAYGLDSKKVDGPSGPYANYTWAHAGKATDEERATAGAWIEQFKSIKDQVGADQD